MLCCGKSICCGCMKAPVYDNQGNKIDEKKCPFCRTPAPRTEEEVIRNEEKRAEANDPQAIYGKGINYRDGICGYPQDNTKALELFNRAGELGYADAYLGIGNAYYYGRGVRVDKKKATHYYELAAMGGDITARHNLGLDEEIAGNFDRALKHWMIAVRGGYDNSLEMIKQFYSKGHASKDDYTTALRSYQTYLLEIKTEQRDEAAAFNSEKYRYY